MSEQVKAEFESRFRDRDEDDWPLEPVYEIEEFDLDGDSNVSMVQRLLEERAKNGWEVVDMGSDGAVFGILFVKGGPSLYRLTE